MDSEDEGAVEEDSNSDDEVDAFPELHPESDTDKSDSDYEDSGDEDGEEDEEDEGEEDEDTAYDPDERLGLYPEPKIVESDITGMPKKMYPEIEPNYDSDSSTEEVRRTSLIL